MGCCLSCRSSSSFNVIRVVHLNGLVQDFNYPITVRQITGNSPKHFVCISAQLLSYGWKPLGPNTQLEPGHLYFVLPYSVFQSDTSSFDLVSLSTRLTAIAKRGGLNARPSKSSRRSTLYSTRTTSNSVTTVSISVVLEDGRSMEQEDPAIVAYRERMSSKARSWRPLLETINERSFSLGCESDLNSMKSETPK